MARKGLQYCVFGKASNTPGYYLDSIQPSPIAGLTGKVNQTIVQDLYDGQVRGIDVEVTGGLLRLELNLDQRELYSYLLGHSDGFGVLDVPPVVGVGVVVRLSSGYRGKIYKAVAFHEPVDEHGTRRETVVYGHLILEGDLFVPDDEKWKDEDDFSALDDAKMWINSRFLLDIGRNLFVSTLSPSLDKLPKLEENVRVVGGIASVANHGLRVTSDKGNSVLAMVWGTNSQTEPQMQGLEAGKTYTWSADAAWKMWSNWDESVLTVNYIRMYCYYFKAGDSAYRALYKTLYTMGAETVGVDVSQHVTITFTVPNDTIGLYLRFSPNGGAPVIAEGDYIEMDNIKLEEGDTETPWCPAPEDLGGA